jgi:hypothetical protein
MLKQYNLKSVAIDNIIKYALVHFDDIRPVNLNASYALYFSTCYYIRSTKHNACTVMQMHFSILFLFIRKSKIVSSSPYAVLFFYIYIYIKKVPERMEWPKIRSGGCFSGTVQNLINY